MPSETFIFKDDQDCPHGPVMRQRFVNFDDSRLQATLRFRHHHPIPLPYGVVPLAQNAPDSRGRVYVLWSDGLLEQHDDPLRRIPTMSGTYLDFLSELRLPPTAPGHPMAGTRARNEQRLRETIVDNIKGLGVNPNAQVPKYDPTADGLRLTERRDYQHVQSVTEGLSRHYTLLDPLTGLLTPPLTEDEANADIYTIRVGVYSYQHYHPRIKYTLTLPDYHPLFCIAPDDPAPDVYHLFALLYLASGNIEAPLKQLVNCAATLLGGTAEAYSEEHDCTCTVDLQTARWLVRTAQRSSDRELVAQAAAHFGIVHT